MLRTKGMFYASYAKNPKKTSTHLCFDFANRARHCGSWQAELEFAERDQLLEKVSSLELRTKLFEEPNIQLAATIDKARA